MEATKDTEVRARIGGVAAQMEFFYGLELGRKILNIVDNLSRSLQRRYMCALDGQKLVQIMLSALQLMRTDNNFKLFWHYVEQRKSKVEGVSSLALVRHKKVPKRFEIGDTASEQQLSSVVDHYRAIYFEAIHTVIGTIKNRFD